MTKKICTLVTVACLGVLCFSGSVLHAQAPVPRTATQTFTVTVPQNISISAPAAVSLLHDETDNNQSFANQPWVVKGNIRNGVLVSFATGSAFVHTQDNTFQRNAKLDLGLGTTAGPAIWTITKATDQTDYATADGIATVEANSNGVGRASFNLGVSFITEEFGLFAAGDYVTTVTGTITAR